MVRLSKITNITNYIIIYSLYFVLSACAKPSPPPSQYTQSLYNEKSIYSNRGALEVYSNDTIYGEIPDKHKIKKNSNDPFAEKVKISSDFFYIFNPGYAEYAKNFESSIINLLSNTDIIIRRNSNVIRLIFPNHELFDDSFNITARGQKLLKNLSAALASYNQMSIIISGHLMINNKPQSEEIALKVASFLVNNDYVESHKVNYIGFSNSKPLSSEILKLKTFNNKKSITNNRIEIRVLPNQMSDIIQNHVKQSETESENN